MSESTNDSESKTGGLVSQLRGPVIFLLGLMAVLGAYYFLYAQKKTNYLMGRNLRLLATMGDGVRASIKSYGDFLKNQDKSAALQIPGLSHTQCPRRIGIARSPQPLRKKGHRSDSVSSTMILTPAGRSASTELKTSSHRLEDRPRRVRI